MMTIDEAIEYERNGSLDGRIPSGNIFKYREQLAEWLEELKKRREYDGEIIGSGALNNAYNQGYQKAIDGFTEKAKAECREHYVDCDPYFGGIIDSILYEDDIDEIAEQLKEGEQNE